MHIETGGNLFGLWTTSGSAAIHVVLGPGQGCKRTGRCYTQTFLQRPEANKHIVSSRFGIYGSFLWVCQRRLHYILCHGGEWRSHHSLILDKSSAEDEITIRRNFPRGMSKFLVIIANIKNDDTIKLSPYFFIDGGERYEIAEYEVLTSDSPFSTDGRIVGEINLGVEGKQMIIIIINILQLAYNKT